MKSDNYILQSGSTRRIDKSHSTKYQTGPVHFKRKPTAKEKKNAQLFLFQDRDISFINNPRSDIQSQDIIVRPLW